MTEEAKSARAKRVRRSFLWWIPTIALAMALVAAVVTTFVFYHAEPILKGGSGDTIGALSGARTVGRVPRFHKEWSPSHRGRPENLRAE